MNELPEATPPPVAGDADRERRREHRRPTQVRATILLDTSGGLSHEVLTRDLTDTGVSFLLRDPLSVGQTCTVTIHTLGRSKSYLAEVIRSRPLSMGKHEMAVQFRKPG